jgi:hypothetical protein
MSWRRVSAAAALVGAAAAASALVLGGTGRAQGARLPSCVQPHARVTPTASLARFPLPVGAVLDRREVRYGYAIYSGYVPGAVNPVRDFFVGRLPAAGFRLGAGDSESAEAEAGYSGHGVHGRWKVRAVDGCPGALAIQIAVRQDAPSA